MPNGWIIIVARREAWLRSFYSNTTKKDLKKDDYAALSEALKDWDREIKKIRDETEELIMMK